MRPSSRRPEHALRSQQRDGRCSSSPPLTPAAKHNKGICFSNSNNNNNNNDDDDGDEEHEYEYEYVERNVVVAPDGPHHNTLPFSDAIQMNWKGSLASDGDPQLKPKERSVFVGCIPEGIENIGEVLHGLMDAFLERFDFAPLESGDILAVKTVKDFAFLELASDKVAQIVLAANQLDLFEWGVNGCHFNIEGCKGTHSSVRPLIEYMPLRPARVIFVGNIPKPHWRRDYIEDAFCTLLWGSDGKMDLKPVISVHLLPESSDAYVELASEYIADALIYKCTKNSQLLRDIGEDVFICRDANSPPMMSRHKIDICPQRSLFIGVSVRDEYFKIDHVRKVFDDVLPLISRKINHYAYIEYISVQPGKDYAFFQFNSETVVDAIMDEYIENTQLFVCKYAPIPLTYIMLRPPEYVRPGARYNSADTLERRSTGLDSRVRGQQKLSFHQATDRKQINGSKQGHTRRHIGEQPSILAQNCRKYVDEPAKKPDCVISIGASPIPSAMWNGPGASSSDPDSLVVIEGLPKGYRYKLLRGALNELFERTLSNTGLLEVGMLVVGYLDRDDDMDIVACLPNADFAYALLSLQSTFIVCGHEVRLLPKDPRKISGRAKPTAMTWVQDELSASSDEEGGFEGADSVHTVASEEWNNSGFSRERKRGFSENVNVYMSGRNGNQRRKLVGSGKDHGVSPMGKEGFYGHQRSQEFNGYHSSRPNEGSYWEDTNSTGGNSRGFKRAGFSSFDNSKAMMQGRRGWNGFQRRNQ